MTITRRNHGTGHSYTVDGVKLPGVTAILGMLPKDALLKWSAEVTANYAVDNWAALARLGPSQRLKQLYAARFADRDAAANRGTAVHRLAEQHARGEDVTIPDELAGHVESYLDFLDRGVKPVAVELVVANRAAGYCGTLDLIADLPPLTLPSGGTVPAARWLLDIKTSRSGIFRESALQVCAYSRAEAFAAEDGSERPMEWFGIARHGALHVRGDGWDLRPLDCGDLTWEFFLRLAWLHHHQEASDGWVGEAAVLPPKPELIGLDLA